MFESCINYQKDIIKNGVSYFYSPALQLINYVLKMPQTDCKFSGVLSNFLGGEIYAQKIIKQKSWFSDEKLGEKEKIAELFYDANEDRITCKLDNEIRQQETSLNIPYLIFKGIRESDLFICKTIERDVRHKVFVYYTATKSALLNAQIDIIAGGLVEVVSIPKAAFKRVVGSPVKSKGKKKNGKIKK